MDTQQKFLHERIINLGSAIFFNLSESVLKLPTSIVRIIHVDDYGYIWFFMQKPQQQLNEFEKEFPVKLDFFRKGDLAKKVEAAIAKQAEARADMVKGPVAVLEISHKKIRWVTQTEACKN